MAIVAHPLVPYPLCASEGTIRRLLDEADPIYHPDAIEALQPDHRPDALEPAGPALAEELGDRGGGRLGRPPCASNVGGGPDPLPRPLGGGPAGRRGRARHGLGGRRLRAGGARSACSGGRQRKNAAAVRDEVRGKLRRDGTGRDLGYPGGRRGRCASTPWPPAWSRSRHHRPVARPRSGSHEDRARHALHLPAAGRRQRARPGYLYENLVARGHDVRIISSTHGPQRSSEGDIIRLGYGWSVPTNGSVGTLTVSHRYGHLVQEMLERERFDVIHFHEPFVPFLSLQVLRRSRAVNVATFHAYSGWSPSYEFGQADDGPLRAPPPRPHRRQRRGAPLHRPLLPGRVQGHPQRRGPRASSDGASPFARWRDGTPNILFVGRFESRKGLMYLLKAYSQLRRDGLDCRLLVVGPGPAGARGAALHRHAATAGRRVPGSACPSADKARAFATADVYVSPGHGPGVVRHRAAGGDGRGRAHRLLATSTATRASCGAASRRCWCRPDVGGARGGAIGQLLRDPPLRARMGASGLERAQSSSAGQRDRQGGRLLRLRHPPPRGHRQPAPWLPRRGPRGPGPRGRPGPLVKPGVGARTAGHLVEPGLGALTPTIGRVTPALGA